MIDRRKAARSASDLRSYVRLLDADQYVDCKLLDISETGARVAVGRPIRKDRQVELHIPGMGQVIAAVVVWSNPTEIGCSFARRYDLAATARALIDFVKAEAPVADCA